MKRFVLENSNNKALVIEDNNVSKLFSYNTTHVATYYHDTNKMEVLKTYSNTTRKHINLFLEFYGFDKCTKKQFKEHYGAEE